jgi:hypothetical protein
MPWSVAEREVNRATNAAQKKAKEDKKKRE